MPYLSLSVVRHALVAFVALLLLADLPPVPAHAQPREAAPSDSLLIRDLEYRMIGPSRGGRVTAVAGHRLHPGTFYFGSTGGGVWKTDDYGHAWRNVSDGFFETASIGAIRVAPSDTNVIYVGTGSDAIRSNVITGRGVYKSTDAGTTWTHVGLRNTGQIGAVEIHPENPDVAYVAALGSAFGPNPERGVYKTTDGGATWEQVLFVSDSTGAIDLELNPADPDEVYAAMWRAERKPWTIISGDPQESGIYKTTDGGATWTKQTDGLPTDLVGKIDLAVSSADPDRLYALVEAEDEDEGLYRSDDRGATFSLVSDSAGLMYRPFYFTNVDADPTDADVVYVGNLRFFKSTDGGATFDRVPTPHVDNHDAWINPDDPQVMIQANDGGVNITRDGGQTWSSQTNQPTAELYTVHVDDRFPYWVYSGQQDNTTIAVPSQPPADSRPGGALAYWQEIGGCETGPTVPKPGDPDIVYANCKGRFGIYNRRTGQERQYYVGAQYIYGRNPADLKLRFQRVAPIAVSPHDPDVVYHGSQFVHRTTDGGETWDTISPDLTANRPETQQISGGPITRDITGEEHYSTLYEIAESPLAPGVIWTGANDGPVHVTRDGGATWTDVTPADLPPGGRVETVEPSPHDPAKAYVAAYRYLLNDWQPYLYRTDDYGQTWTRLTDGTNGIPADSPTRVVREDPDREGLLYAGTEFGLYVSFDDGATWQPLQQNLPVTPVTDLKVHEQDLIVATMGRSFWVLDNLTPLHQRDDVQAASGLHLYAPRDAYRLRHSAGGYGLGQRHPSDPTYLPPGALIDFHVPTAPADGEAVTLEILRADGEVLRTFSSTASREGAGEGSDPRAVMQGTDLAAAAPQPLDVQAGHNRFRWNLQVPGTWRDGRRREDGPMVEPGFYQVRLTAGGETMTQPLRVLIDPRVDAEGITEADLAAQFALNLDTHAALSEARRVAATVEEELEDAPAGAPRTAALQALHAELVTSDEGSYPPPMLIDQLNYLYRMTTRSDQRPGRDAYERYAELRRRLDAAVATWMRWQETDAAGSGGR